MFYNYKHHLMYVEIYMANFMMLSTYLELEEIQMLIINIYF